jgi:hypothetical protein
MKIAEHSPLDQIDIALDLGAVPRALPEVLTLEVKNRTNIFGVRVGLLINPASKSYRRLPPSTLVTGMGRVGSVKAMAAARSVKSVIADFNAGTLGTGISMSRAHAREDNTKTFKELKRGVPSVPEDLEVLPPIAAVLRLPFLTADGTLVIPFDSPERFHWRKRGQSVAETYWIHF